MAFLIGSTNSTSISELDVPKSSNATHVTYFLDAGLSGMLIRISAPGALVSLELISIELLSSESSPSDQETVVLLRTD